MRTIDARAIKAARKNHKCNLCGQSIEKGNPYQVWKGIYEGDFLVFKRHHECNAATERTIAHTGDCELNKEVTE